MIDGIGLLETVNCSMQGYRIDWEATEEEGSYDGI
jgi:hypothetical protein